MVEEILDKNGADRGVTLGQKHTEEIRWEEEGKPSLRRCHE